jgi:hypothetical protein
MKQTKETMTSWTGGDANHGSLNPSTVKRLYFQELGSWSVVLSLNEWSAELTSWAGTVPFSLVAISQSEVDDIGDGGADAEVMGSGVLMLASGRG